MAGDRALGRLGRVLRGIEAPGALDDIRLAKGVRLATGLWADAFAREVGAPCAAARPEAAASAFALCPDPNRDAAGFRTWHRVQAGLFLHYAPVAGRLLGPGSAPGERAAVLLLADALRLLGAHASALGRDDARYRALLPPPLPFARLFHDTPRLRSHRSADVNLGAVAIALAMDSGFRHALGLPPDARLSMWRLFRALAAEGSGVRLAVELPVLAGVYAWAGRHRGAGRRGHGWLNYFAADLLHPLFVSPLGFGLEASPAALARLRAAASGFSDTPYRPPLRLIAG